MRGPVQERISAIDGQSIRVLVWERDLVDMWVLDDAGGRRPYRGSGSSWHHHPDLELTLITRGEGLLHVGDHVGRFTAPDCLLLGRHLPHVWKAEGETAGISLQFQLDPAGGLGALAEASGLARLQARSRFGLRWRGATAARLQELLAGLEGRPALVRLARFIDILDALRRGSGDGRQLSAEALRHEGDGARSDALGRVLDHLMAHSDEEIRLADMVRLSGWSQATFCRQFLRLTGTTFARHLTALRVQEVRRALAQTRRTVTDIAFGAGFASLTSFHAAFRRAAGCTPLEFRRRLAPAVPRKRRA